MSKKVMVSELMYAKIEEAYNQSIKEEYTEKEKESFFYVYSENIKKALEKRDFKLVKANAYFLCKVFGCEDSDSVINEYEKSVMSKMKSQYGKEKGEKVYYATANKQDRNPETFELNEYNKEVMASMEKKYGKEKAKAIYYATANKYGYDPETFKKKK